VADTGTIKIATIITSSPGYPIFQTASCFVNWLFPLFLVCLHMFNLAWYQFDSHTCNEHTVLRDLHCLSLVRYHSCLTWTSVRWFFPTDHFQDFVFTCEDYTPVTDASPMFAIDCEMVGLLSCKDIIYVIIAFFRHHKW